MSEETKLLSPAQFAQLEAMWGLSLSEVDWEGVAKELCGHIAERERQYAELVAAATEIASIKDQSYFRVIRVPEEWLGRLRAALAALSPVSPPPAQPKGDR